MLKNVLFLLKNRKNCRAHPCLRRSSPPDSHWSLAAGGSTLRPPD